MNTQTDPTALSAPTLSVVVPVHNGARWLGETLSSILSQSFGDFELLLVDDASTDDLRGVLREFQDPRLHVVHLEKNVGVAGARNQGIARARGQYIAFCDADDICLPGRFEKQLAYLQQNPQVGVCGTAFTCFDTQDRETVRHPGADAEIKSTLMKGNCFGMSTMMGRAELFHRHAFDQAMSPTEDYDMWTRLASEGVRMANLPDSLLRYRVHAQQASQQKSQKLDQLARKIRSLYCARLLGDAALLDRMRAETIELADLDAAAVSVAEYCARNPGSSPYAFRFMLAWLYQKLPHHGVKAWRYWRKIQAQLGLILDRNYRFNIALLALLPAALVRNHFDTLVKLKR